MTKFPRDKLVLFEGIALIIFTIMKINVRNYHYNDIYILAIRKESSINFCPINIKIFI